MNIKKEMFGEPALVSLARRLKGKSAEEVVEAIHKEVATFTGRAKQHDDVGGVCGRNSPGSERGVDRGDQADIWLAQDAMEQRLEHA